MVQMVLLVFLRAIMSADSSNIQQLEQTVQTAKLEMDLLERECRLTSFLFCFLEELPEQLALLEQAEVVLVEAEQSSTPTLIFQQMAAVEMEALQEEEEEPQLRAQAAQRDQLVEVEMLGVQVDMCKLEAVELPAFIMVELVETEDQRYLKIGMAAAAAAAAIKIAAAAAAAAACLNTLAQMFTDCLERLEKAAKEHQDQQALMDKPTGGFTT